MVYEIVNSELLYSMLNVTILFYSELIMGENIWQSTYQHLRQVFQM